MFNDYVWELYLKSDGKGVVDFFERSINDQMLGNYSEKICELHSTYCPSKEIREDIVRNSIEELYKDITEEDRGFLYGCNSIFEMPEKEYGFDEAFAIFYEGLRESGKQSEKEVMSEFIFGMAYYTTFLSMASPEYFVPYYFQYNFNVLERIMNEFNIPIPEIPLKREYKKRVFYYSELCKVFIDFRNEHSMSPYEFCAFLYDFAPKYIGGIESYIISDLPEPRSVYFIGGDKDDAFLSDSSSIITPWQCNPDTHAGDLIVMYLRTPISAIDSVWRSVSVGFNDPFFYYYRCTYIARPEKVRQIPLKKLQTDPVFKNLPIVRKNMQGINGVEILPSTYNHILDVSGSKMDRLKYTFEEADGIYQREKDVEEKLIKPFLKKLGYTESDYRQQLYIEIGNHNHALIPDFVINPVVKAGHQSGDFLIEAKLSIPAIKTLDEAKKQARGYAKLLGAEYSVIASKEGIWITGKRDDYSSDLLSYTWTELEENDSFYEVIKLLGNKSR